jgi:hypothetical protein
MPLFLPALTAAQIEAELSGTYDPIGAAATIFLNDYAGVDPTGVADSTVGVQNAINALGANGGQLNYDGQFKLSGVIVRPAGQTWRGTGASKSSFSWAVDLGANTNGTSIGTLSTALVASTNYTTLHCSAGLSAAIPKGAILTLTDSAAPLYWDRVLVTAAASIAATSITVQSFAPIYSYTTSTPIVVNVCGIVSGWGGGTQEGNAGQTYNTQFSGPGGGSLGQVGSYMYGYWPTSHEYFENCLWQRFFSNLLIAYDHQTFFRCSISQSYYACDFADNPITKGNQNFLECNMAGYLAVFHCGGNNLLNYALIEQTEVGNSPVGFFKTDNFSSWDGSGNPLYAGTPSQLGLLAACDLREAAFESIGNCCILDISTGTGSGSDSIYYTSIFNTGHSWNGNPSSASLISVVSVGQWAVYIRNLTGSTIDGGATPFNGSGSSSPYTAIGVWHITSQGYSWIKQPLAGIPSNFFGSGSTYSAGLGNIRVGDVTGMATGSGAQNVVAAGQMVEFNNPGGVRRATGAAEVAGIAVTPASTGYPLLVQYSGTTPAIATVGPNAIATAGTTISLDTTTKTSVGPNTSNPTMPVVGIALDNSGSPATTTYQFLLALRGFPPTTLAALINETYTTNVIAVASNAAAVPITYKYNNITNNAAAAVTITLAVTGAVDNQACILSFYDHSAVAQTLTFVNTENVVASVPATSSGSTTVPLKLGFLFNAVTSLWHYAGEA